MSKTVSYKNKQVQVRSGQWADEMNRCFYRVIDEIKRYLICIDLDGEVFALECIDADGDGRHID